MPTPKSKRASPRIRLGGKRATKDTPMNRRQLRFADLVIAGIPVPEAYLQAGFTTKDQKYVQKNASNLRNRPHIATYIEDGITRRDTAKLATLEAERKWVMDTLRKDHDLAIAENAFAPAVRALELYGKELGMFRERVEVKDTTEDRQQPPEDAEDKLALLQKMTAAAQAVIAASERPQAGESVH